MTEHGRWCKNMADGARTRQMRSEVGVEGELVPGVVSRLVRHHAHLLVLGDLLLKEVRLALQRDVRHEVKWVLTLEQLRGAETK